MRKLFLGLIVTLILVGLFHQQFYSAYMYLEFKSEVSGLPSETIPVTVQKIETSTITPTASNFSPLQLGVLELPVPFEGAYTATDSFVGSISDTQAIMVWGPLTTDFFAHLQTEYDWTVTETERAAICSLLTPFYETPPCSSSYAFRVAFLLLDDTAITPFTPVDTQNLYHRILTIRELEARQKEKLFLIDTFTVKALLMETDTNVYEAEVFTDNETYYQIILKGFSLDDTVSILSSMQVQNN